MKSTQTMLELQLVWFLFFTFAHKFKCFGIMCFFHAEGKCVRMHVSAARTVARSAPVSLELQIAAPVMPAICGSVRENITR